MKLRMMITSMSLLMASTLTAGETEDLNHDISADVKSDFLYSHPNTFHKSVTLEFSVDAVQYVEAQLVAADGSRSFALYSGIAAPDEMHIFRITGDGFAAGMYFFTVTLQDGTIQAAKLFVTK